MEGLQSYSAKACRTAHDSALGSDTVVPNFTPGQYDGSLMMDVYEIQLFLSPVTRPAEAHEGEGGERNEINKRWKID